MVGLTAAHLAFNRIMQLPYNECIRKQCISVGINLPTWILIVISSLLTQPVWSWWTVTDGKRERKSLETATSSIKNRNDIREFSILNGAYTSCVNFQLQWLYPQRSWCRKWITHGKLMLPFIDWIQNWCQQLVLCDKWEFNDTQIKYQHFITTRSTFCVNFDWLVMHFHDYCFFYSTIVGESLKLHAEKALP